MNKTAEERFWAKVNKDGPLALLLGTKCWLWTAGTWQSRNGAFYGQFTADGRKMGAHRFAYQLVHGEIPEGYQVDHLCHNTLCVNYETHLRLATNKQNHENLNGAMVSSATGIRGVSWHKEKRKWRAVVSSDGVYHHVGYFADIEDAKAAVIAKRLELFTHNELDRV